MSNDTKWCPAHGKRDQDGYGEDGRCNAIVGYVPAAGVFNGWPILCGRDVSDPRPRVKKLLVITGPRPRLGREGAEG